MRAIWLMVLLAAMLAESVWGVIIDGSVVSAESGLPLPAATIRVEGTGRASLTNDLGKFRIRLDPGAYRLKFSHVAHHSHWIDLDAAGSDTSIVVSLQPAIIVVSGARVTSYAYDAAQEIILQAIARKEKLLSMIEKYEFDAYTKMVICDTSKEDSNSVFMIAESQVTGVWAQPDNYSQTIVSRRQTANIEAGDAIIGVMERLDFNRNRIELGEYSVVSPVATDALKHYNYYLIDTIWRDNTAIYRLGIEPKNNNRPLFTGTIDIVDSLYAVVGVEVGGNEAFDWGILSDVKYSQQHGRFEDDIWMPVEVRFGCIVSIPLFGTYSVDYLAAPYDYRFEMVIPDDAFDYALQVDLAADEYDSVAWNAGQVIPLTDLEQRGYEYRDSLANVPPGLIKHILRGAGWLLAKSLFNPDFFHFNCVEGPYLGYSADTWLGSTTRFDARAGYAFDAERFQHAVRLTQRLRSRRRIDLTLEHRHRISPRPTVITAADYNPTIWALTNKTDPFDYYREEGFQIDLAGDIVRHWRLRAGYHDFQHYSEQSNSEYSFFRETKTYRPNPSIDDGHLRALSAELRFDSRPLVKLKREEQLFPALPATQWSLGIEKADPNWIDNDFDYVRYWTDWQHTRSLPGLGVATLRFYAGGSDRSLPPQRYYTIDFGDEIGGSDLNFKTLGESGFSGHRTALAYATHDFGRRLWRATGLPVVRDIPFSVGLHGGVFASEFEQLLDVEDLGVEPDERTFLRHAPTAYSEIGFSLGRITPFGLRLYFTWQLSNYDTNDFTFHFGFGR